MARYQNKKDVINIPRGKLVGYNGPGSMYVNTEGISYIISAVDKWYNSNQKVDLSHYKIHDSRLERLLNVSHFREVPTYRNPYEVDNKTNSGISIPISRFPLVHYCSSCGYLLKAKSGDFSKRYYCSQCKTQKDFVQFPIVIACQIGHLGDFPFFDYVHRNKQVDNSIRHDVSVDWEGKNSILNWTLKCTCGAKHGLKGITGKSTGEDKLTPFQREMNGMNCTGDRPWSGEIDSNCEFKPEAILKNSLRIYQPEMVPVLSLSDSKNIARNDDYNQILLEEFEKLAGKEIEEDPNKLTVELSFKQNEFSIIKKVNYIRRLQEIIVQTGFNRLSPVNSGIEKATKMSSESSKLFSSYGNQNWFPAKKMYGEGIFIEFNEKILHDWAENIDVRRRFDEINSRIDDNFENDYFSSPIHILIHTLSHGLIKALSSHSGYSMTATKEKLYFIDGKYGLLIYVTDSDRDGTFGGLVRLAEEQEFKKHFINSLKSMEWCSSDPVCFEIGSNHGQGLGNTNGSACHNCSFIPITSCTHRNCYLDRDYVGRSEASECITYNQQYSWFDTKKQDVIVTELGTKFIYKDWEEASAYEHSDYYRENIWAIPDYMDGFIRIGSTIYAMKYYNKKSKQIVLYNNQNISKKLLSEISDWEIIIEKD